MRSFPLSSHIVSLALLTASFTHSLCAADSRPQAVQQALKQRGFYFGEINGVVDDQTKGALKRFQIREGLTVTGEIDAGTVAALQNESPNSSDAALKKMSARERAQSVIQSDQEFLDKVESLEGRRTANSASSPPAAPTSIRPQQTFSNESPPAAAETTAEIGHSTSSAKTKVEQEAKKRKALSAEPTNLPAVAEHVDRSSSRGDAANERVSSRPSTITEMEMSDFLSDYMRAAEGPTPANEVSFYADEVDYFDNGKVSRSFIENDQRNYYRRWPVRDFQLVSPPQIDRLSGTDATMRFQIRYSLSGNKQTANGMTENLMRIRKAGRNGGLKIVAIRERKIRE